ncbi:MAG: hypothetical protein B6I34_04630 [Anaerolineaceae bacterium 4572_32.1]|nr:MAG: hypothetical protein B6I34_04630 [Anaerolineaceae bacterium 4572_32.1]
MADRKISLQQQMDSLAAFGCFVDLAAYQNLDEMLSEALSVLVRVFDADGASLLYVGQLPVRVQQGVQDEPLKERILLWEESLIKQLRNLQRRISSSPKIPFNLQPIPRTRKALLTAPLIAGKKIVGFISLVCPPDYKLNNFQHQLLGHLSQGIGSQAKLLESLSLTRQRLKQLGIFYQMSQALVSTFDLPQLLQDTMQLAASVINAGASSLMLVDEEQQELVFAAVHGTKGTMLRSQRISIDEGIAGWVVTHGEPVIANDVAQDPRFSRRVDVRTGFLTHSILAVPMQIRGKTIGVLEVLNKREKEGFDEEDLRLLLALAAEAAIAIDNARLVQELREERDRILNTQEKVRHELNRKLHDGTVQLLAAIAMGIDHVERLLQLKPEAVYAELEALRKLTRQATREARMLLFELRPVILESQGLIPALRRYVEQLQESETFHIHFDDGEWDKPLNHQVAGAIFSIVQETVNNTRKHAKANNLWIRLGATDSHLLVHIEDDGKGFDVDLTNGEYEKRDSFGLLNMRERAALIEGVLTIESSEVMPEQGTLVTLSVPLSRALADSSEQDEQP